MNHKYQITIAWSQQDKCYLVYLPDFADERQFDEVKKQQEGE